jgi:Reverse transcriptase (RNA-dependent DNA polymerase)
MVQKSDVVACFDRIPHDLLLFHLSFFLGSDNKEIIDLVSAFLKADILDKNGKNWATPNIGIPQGSSISPVLMNVYLHSLDVRMGKLATSVYDDILLGFKTRDSIPGLTLSFNKGLADLKLEIKSEKIWRGEGRPSSQMKILGLIFSITEDGKLVARLPFID